MRLIATRLLPSTASAVYTHGELAQRRALRLPTPPQLSRIGKRFHLYVSSANAGAAELIRELEGFLGSARRDARQCFLEEASPPTRSDVDAGQALSSGSPPVRGRRFWRRQATNETVLLTSQPAELETCHAMLVYLHGHTWATGEGDCSRLAAEVALAMVMGVPLVLIHEMESIGGDGQHMRHACAFGDVLRAAPESLVRCGLYAASSVVGLKGGAMRSASHVRLAKAICAPRAPVISAMESRTLNRFCQSYVAQHQMEAIDLEFAQVLSHMRKNPRRSLPRSLATVRRRLAGRDEDFVEDVLNDERGVVERPPPNRRSRKQEAPLSASQEPAPAISIASAPATEERACVEAAARCKRMLPAPSRLPSVQASHEVMKKDAVGPLPRSKRRGAPPNQQLAAGAPAALELVGATATTASGSTCSAVQSEAGLPRDGTAQFV